MLWLVAVSMVAFPIFSLGVAWGQAMVCVVSDQHPLLVAAKAEWHRSLFPHEHKVAEQAIYAGRTGLQAMISAAATQLVSVAR